MEDNKYASRKFIMFLITNIFLLFILWYCIYSGKDTHINSILMSVVTVLGTYAGINVGEKSLPGLIGAIKELGGYKKETPGSKT